MSLICAWMEVDHEKASLCIQFCPLGSTCMLSLIFLAVTSRTSQGAVVLVESLISSVESPLNGLIHSFSNKLKSDCTANPSILSNTRLF